MSTIYVNSEWSTKQVGDIVEVNGVQYTIGTDAFATVAAGAAVAGASAGNVLQVQAGTYSEDDIKAAQGIELVFSDANVNFNKDEVNGNNMWLTGDHVLSIDAGTSISGTVLPYGKPEYSYYGDYTNMIFATGSLTFNEFNGTLVADGLHARAIRSQGDMTFNGDLGGVVDVKQTGYTQWSYGAITSWGNMLINGDLTGNISNLALKENGVTGGRQVGGLFSNKDFSLDGALSGTIVAKHMEGNSAWGIYATGKVTIQSGITSTGSIHAEVGNSSNAYGISSEAGISISGGMAGKIYGHGGSGSGFGLYSKGNVSVDEVSGSITGEAFTYEMANTQCSGFAIYAAGDVNGGTNSTALNVTSGAVLSGVAGRSNAYGIYSGGYLNVNNSGIISAQSAYLLDKNHEHEMPLDHSNGKFVDFTYGGIAVGVSSKTGMNLVNSGTISAVAQSKYSNDVESLGYAVYSGDSTPVYDRNLNEYVLVPSTVAAADVVYNNGSMIGHVSLFAGADFLSNSGTIQGNVDMGIGNDTFVMDGGSVSGFVDMGIGTDLVEVNAAWSLADLRFGTDGKTMKIGAGGSFSGTISIDAGAVLTLDVLGSFSNVVLTGSGKLFVLDKTLNAADWMSRNNITVAIGNSVVVETLTTTSIVTVDTESQKTVTVVDALGDERAVDKIENTENKKLQVTTSVSSEEKNVIGSVESTTGNLELNTNVGGGSTEISNITSGSDVVINNAVGGNLSGGTDSVSQTEKGVDVKSDSNVTVANDGHANLNISAKKVVVSRNTDKNTLVGNIDGEEIEISSNTGTINANFGSAATKTILLNNNIENDQKGLVKNSTFTTMRESAVEGEAAITMNNAEGAVIQDSTFTTGTLNLNGKGQYTGLAVNADLLQVNEANVDLADTANLGGISSTGASVIVNRGNMEISSSDTNGTALVVWDGAMNFTNSGIMSASNAVANAFAFFISGGDITGTVINNQAGASIYGDNGAIFAWGNPVSDFTINNAGTLSSHANSAAIYLVTNTAGYGLVVNNEATGNITTGMYLCGADLTLMNKGIISDGIYGQFFRAENLTNYGTINGDIGFTGEKDDSVILMADSVMNGKINFAAGNDTLENNITLTSEIIAANLTVSGAGSFSGNMTIDNLTVADGNAMILNSGMLLTLSTSLAFGTGASLTINAASATEAIYKVIDYTGTGSVEYGTVSVTGDYITKVIDKDLYIVKNVDMSVIMVDAAWSTKAFGETVEVGGNTYVIGLNAFSTAGGALTARNENTTKIEILSDTAETVTSSGPFFTILNDMVISAGTAKTLSFTGDDIVFDSTSAAGKPVLSIDENVSILSDKVVYLGYYYAPDFVVNGSISGTQIWIGALTTGDAKVTVSETGRLASTGEAFITRYGASLTVNGNAAVGSEEAARTLQMDANYSVFHSGTIAFNDTYVKSGPVSLGTGTSLDANYDTSMTLSNSILRSTGSLSNKAAANPKTSVVTLKNHSLAFFTAVTNRALLEMYDSSLTVTGKMDTSDRLVLSGESKLSAKDIVNSASLTMSYSSQITFSGTFSNTGTITVDVTGMTDAAAGYYKLLDYTGSGTYTVDDYKTLFGSNWNSDFCVIQNDLFVANVFLDVVYVGTENKIVDVGGKPYYMKASLTDALAIVAEGGNIIIQDSTKSYRFEDFINTKSVKVSSDFALNITTDGSSRTFNLENAVRNDLYALYQIKKSSASAFVFDDFNDKITFNLTNPNDYYFGAIIANPAASTQNSGTDIIFNTFSGSITMNAVAASDKVPIQLYVSGICANKGAIMLGNFTGSINTDLQFNSVATKDSTGIQTYGVRAGGLITVGNVFSGTIQSALHSTTELKPNLVTSHGLASVDGLKAGIQFDNTIMTGKIIASVDGNVGKGNYNSWGITYGIYAKASQVSGNLTMKSGAQIIASSNTNRFASADGFNVKVWNLNLIVEEGALISADAFSSTNSTTIAYGICAEQMAGSIVIAGTLSATGTKYVPNLEEFPGDPGFPSSVYAIYADELFSTTQTITIGNTSVESTAKAVIKGDVYIGAGNSTNQNKGTMNLVGRSDITGNFEITDYTVNFKSGYSDSTFTGIISAYALNLESDVSATVSGHIFLTGTISLASGSTLNLTLDTENPVLSAKGFSVSGKIVIDMTGATDDKYFVIDNIGSDTFDYSNVVFSENDRFGLIENGDLYVVKAVSSMENVFVDAAWAGKQNGEAVKVGDKYYVFGTNAFAAVDSAIGNALATGSTLHIASGIYTGNMAIPSTFTDSSISIADHADVTLVAQDSGNVTIYGNLNVSGAASLKTAQGDNKKWFEIWGNVSVSGEGSSWNHGYMVAVKEGATLTIADKAVVDLGYIAAGGVITVDNATLNLGNAAGTIVNNLGGYAVGAPETVMTLQNAAKLTSTKGFNIGHRGPTSAAEIADPNFSKDAKVYVNSGSSMEIGGDLVRIGAAMVTNPTRAGKGGLYIDGEGSSVIANNGLIVGAYRVDGKGGEGTLELTNGANLTVSGGAFIGGDGVTDGLGILKLSGNSSMTVDSLTLGFAGTGSITIEGGSLLTAETVTIKDGGSITLSYSSAMKIGSFTNQGSFSVDMTGAAEDKYLVIDNTGSSIFDYSSITISNSADYFKFIENGDLYVVKGVVNSKEQVFVNSVWTGKMDGEVVSLGDKYYVFGTNAFAAVQTAMDNVDENGTVRIVSSDSLPNQNIFAKSMTISGTKAGLTLDSNGAPVITNSGKVDPIYQTLADATLKALRNTDVSGKTIVFEQGVIAGLANEQSKITMGGNELVIGKTGASNGDLLIDGHVFAEGGTVTLNSGFVRGSLLGGSEGKLVEGNTEIVMNGGWVNQSVQGGGNSWSVTGTSTITINGGKVGFFFDKYGDPEGVFGGSRRGTVGATEINIGGTAEIEHSIYGGGYARKDVGASVTGDVSIHISGGTVNNVYGGGLAFATTSQGGAGNTASDVNGNVSILVSGGVINGNLCAGGNIIQDAGLNMSASVQGNATVTISGGKINGGVFGGGVNGATVAGTKTLNFTNADAYTFTGTQLGAFDSVNLNGSDLTVKGTQFITDLSFSGAGKQLLFSGVSSVFGITVDGAALTVADGSNLSALTGTNGASLTYISGTIGSEITGFSSVTVNGSMTVNTLLQFTAGNDILTVNKSLVIDGSLDFGSGSDTLVINNASITLGDVVVGDTMGGDPGKSYLAGLENITGSGILYINDSTLTASEWISAWKAAGKTIDDTVTVKTLKTDNGNTNVVTPGSNTIDFVKDDTLTEQAVVNSVNTTGELNLNVSNPNSAVQDNSMEVRGDVVSSNDKVSINHQADGSLLSVTGSVQAGSDINILQSSDNSMVAIAGNVTGQNVIVNHSADAGLNTNVVLGNVYAVNQIEMNLTGSNNIVRDGIAATGSNSNVNLNLGSEASLTGENRGAVNVGGDTVTISNDGHLHANVSAKAILIAKNTSVNTLTGVYEAETILIQNNSGVISDAQIGKTGTTKTIGMSDSATGRIVNSAMIADDSISLADFGTFENTTVETAALTLGSGTMTGSNSVALFKTSALVNGAMDLTSGATLRGVVGKTLTNSGTLSVTDAVLDVMFISNAGTVNVAGASTVKAIVDGGNVVFNNAVINGDSTFDGRTATVSINGSLTVNRLSSFQFASISSTDAVFTLNDASAGLKLGALDINTLNLTVSSANNMANSCVTVDGLTAATLNFNIAEGSLGIDPNAAYTLLASNGAFSATSVTVNGAALVDGTFMLGTTKYMLNTSASGVTATLANVAAPVIGDISAVQSVGNYNFTVDASVSGGNGKLSYEFVNLPDYVQVISTDKTNPLKFTLTDDTKQSLTLTLKVTDEKNLSVTKDVTIAVKDYTAPVFTEAVKVEQSGMTYGFTITAKAFDNFDGNDVTYVYRFADNSRMSNATTFDGNTFMLDAVNAAKTYYVQVSAYDKAGNMKQSETVSFTVADVTAPEIESVGATQVGGSYTFQFAYRDSDNVGVTARNYRWSETESGLESAGVSVLGDLVLPTNTIKNFFYQMQSVDAAGNKTWSAVQSVTVKDYTAPVFNSVTVDQAGKTYGFTISADATDNFDGKLVSFSYYFSEDKTNWTKLDGMTFSLDQYSVGKNYYVKVDASDFAGNVATSNVVTVSAKDVTDPELLTYKVAQGLRSYNFTFSATGTDNYTPAEDLKFFYRWAETSAALSGNGTLTSQKLVLDSNYANSTLYYQVRAMDAAGNYSDWSGATAFTVAADAGSSIASAEDLTGQQHFINGNVGLIGVNNVEITQDAKSVFYSVNNVHASKTTISIDGLKAGEKIKIRMMNADGKTLKTVTASVGSNGKAIVKNVLTQAGTMFIALESASKKTNNAAIQLGIENAYFHEASENNDFASSFALEQHPQSTMDSTFLVSKVSGWVGYGDATDTYQFSCDYARKLTIGLVSTETKVKFSVYNALGKRLASYSANEKTSADKFAKNLLLDSGTYFIKVDSGDNGKGKYNGSFNFSATEQVFNKVTDDSFLNPTVYNPETGASGWVGYSDAANFYKFEVAMDSNVSFDLSNTDDGIKVGSQLKIALYDMSTGKKLSIKSVKNDATMDFITSKSLAAGSYCAVVMTSNQKKYMSSYNLNIASV